jgi:hypothetical protein
MLASNSIAAVCKRRFWCGCFGKLSVYVCSISQEFGSPAKG